ncbi:hypothetical protein PV733_28230 [Streptomyces europaeiscabiei]|uniref:hypothetical protein n=1 Tax=Streptomyces europaeiscabiei TaxID=146819 RepID=UPI0029B5C9C0|nr:hypothetical protein [Streptomyces europaeiscabiei]MDX3712759.1 hypothetical protein [Streptomyces europaeiscabiei]
MNVTAINQLNDVITARIARNAEEALRKGVQAVPSSDARIIQVGTAALSERWRCIQDHGFGTCGEALLNSTEAAQLLGNPDDSDLDEPAGGWLMVEDLDPALGFVSTELFHHSHVSMAFAMREVAL